MMKCHRCGSYNIKIVEIDNEEYAVIWCFDCEEQTLDSVIKCSDDFIQRYYHGR